LDQVSPDETDRGTTQPSNERAAPKVQFMKLADLCTQGELFVR
jgi:hypothetical protein